MRIFNGVEYLLFLLFLGTAIELLLKFIQKMGVTLFSEPLKLLINIAMSDVTQFMGFVALAILILLLPELAKRLKKDKIINLLHSIHETIVFRRFLKQYHPSTSTGEGRISVTGSHTLSKFNRSVHYAVLDFSGNSLTLYVKVQKSAQAQKILKEHEVQFKLEISNLYPEYLISTFERKKHQLWLIGTKKIKIEYTLASERKAKKYAFLNSKEK